MAEGKPPSVSGPLGRGHSLNILRVRCRSAEEFRGFYNTDHPSGGIFCPTTKQLAPDDEVVVEIVCKALPNRVFIRGTVVSWRPALPRLRVRAGALVKFATEEAAKRDFVLETLGGQRKPLRIDPEEHGGGILLRRMHFFAGKPLAQFVAIT